MNALSSKRFQPQEGSSRGLLRDCKIFANVRFCDVFQLLTKRHSAVQRLQPNKLGPGIKWNNWWPLLEPKLQKSYSILSIQSYILPLLHLFVSVTGVFLDTLQYQIKRIKWFLHKSIPVKALFESMVRGLENLGCIKSKLPSSVIISRSHSGERCTSSAQLFIQSHA